MFPSKIIASLLLSLTACHAGPVFISQENQSISSTNGKVLSQDQGQIIINKDFQSLQKGNAIVTENCGSTSSQMGWKSSTLQVGGYAMAQFGGLGIINDQTSGIVLGPKTSIIIYRDDGFDTTNNDPFITVENPSSNVKSYCLSGTIFDNVASSFTVTTMTPPTRYQWAGDAAINSNQVPPTMRQVLSTSECGDSIQQTQLTFDNGAYDAKYQHYNPITAKGIYLRPFTKITLYPDYGFRTANALTIENASMLAVKYCLSAHTVAPAFSSFRVESTTDVQRK